MSTTTSRVRKSERFALVLDRLMDEPGLTRTDLDLLPVYVSELQSEGLIKVHGKVESGKRGRPAHTFALTSKARKRVQRARAKAQAQNVNEVVA
jgi:hypothetical protein